MDTLINIELANHILRILAASQVLLFMGILLLSKNPAHIRAIGLALMGAIVIYFFIPLFDPNRDMNQPGSFICALPSLIPILTLLFVWSVFEEGCTIPTWLIGLFGIELTLTCWRVFHGYSSSEGELAAQLLKVFAAAYSIYIVWKGRENDLVEIRQKIRLVFIGVLTITVLGVSISEVFVIYDIDLPGSLLATLWMFGFSILGNIAFIKMNPQLNLVGDPKELVVEQDTQDPAIEQLLNSMQEERLYADHDLRVGSLADKLGIPEYQLRKKINQNLGYRNFNQFVNRYRIEEAGEKLLEDTKTPVLTIALDVGFRSISSFNTAFQTYFGVSPTQYRSQSLSNS